MPEIFIEHPQWMLPLFSFSVLAVLIFFEAGYGIAKHRAVYSAKDTACNLAMYAGSFLINLFWVSVVFAVYVAVHHHSVWKLGRQWWLFEGDTKPWEWVALFLLDDLVFYLFHRSSHYMRVLWASHVNHHSSRRLNFTTALRQTWTPFSASLFWLPLAFVGFDPLMILTMQTLSLTYQSWLHTQLVPALGPLEWLFNTPAHHRVHHAVRQGRDGEHVDANFGGVLILWDRLFGTFEGTFAAQEGVPVYGLQTQLESYNPVRVAFHEWLAVFADLGRARSLRKLPAILIHPKWGARSGRRSVVGPALILSLVWLLGFPAPSEADARAMQEARLLSHLGAVQSYEATLAETGLLSGEAEVVSEIRYARPGSYFIRTVAPAALQGTISSFNGVRWVTYYPGSKYAIELVHLKPFTIAEQVQLLKDQFNEDLDHYLYEVGQSTTIAGLPTVRLTFEAKIGEAKSGAAKIADGESDVYDEYSFPLAMRLKFKAGAQYAYHYRDIMFNKVPPTADFDFRLPADAVVSHWDLDSRNYTAAQARQAADFKFRLPTALPRQLSLAKIIRQRGPVVAYLALYENRPYFLNVTVFKDYGESLIPAGYGVKMKDQKKGQLVPGPHSSSYSFVESGTRYIVVTDLPLDELLKFMDSF